MLVDEVLIGELLTVDGATTGTLDDDISQIVLSHTAAHGGGSK